MKYFEKQASFGDKRRVTSKGRHPQNKKVFVGLDTPTRFHKGREIAAVANTNVYKFKDKETVKSFIDAVRTKGFGPEVWKEYDQKGDIHSFRQYRTKPFIFGRGTYNSAKHKPLQQVYVGIDDPIKNNDRMSTAYARTIGISNDGLNSEKYPRTSRHIIIDKGLLTEEIAAMKKKKKKVELPTNENSN